MHIIQAWQRVALLYLSVLHIVQSAGGNFTASQERILQDIYQVIAHDFHYRRHEWSFAAVRYAGFLQFFGRSWRLVTRLGGTYTVGTSAYYNRWNWNSALDTSIEFLRDLERYHRVYRHLSWENDKRLQVEWYRRYPQHWPDAVTFLDFMASQSGRLHNTSGAATPGYLAIDQHYTELLRLANNGYAECRTALANATRQLLDTTVRIIEATSRQGNAILYSEPLLSRRSSSGAVKQLVAIATEYATLSGLIWDAIPGLLSNYSSAYSSASPGCLNQSVTSAGDHPAGRDNNISRAAASLGRQVLTHVLLYMQHYQGRWSQASANEAPGVDFDNEQRAALITFYCRVVQEDVDKDLTRHLETSEMAQLAQLLDRCQQTSVTGDTVYSALEGLWRQLRTRISREYSAFQQYSNRIPAILQAKSAIKFALPVVATVGVGFNSIIVLYYARHTQVRRVGRNFLIALLACFDTCILLASNLVLFTDKYMEHDQELKPNGGSDLWCKFQAYLLNLTVESSAFVVVILSIERFLAVYSLFRQSASAGSRKELPLRQLSIMALCAFCFACIFNCMLIIGDEVAAPAKSTVGRQCVHYVRLHNFRGNLVFVTMVKPVLNALVRSLLPYSLVCLLSLATCWLLFKKGAYQSLREEEYRLEQQQQQQQQDGQLAKALGQLGLALAYLVLTAPAPVIYILFMTAHADRLIVKLTNGLYDEVDPVFRAHWSRIGQLTVAQYATEYVLVPLSASINFWVFYLTDRSFRLYVNSGLRHGPQRAAAAAVAGAQEELVNNSSEGAQGTGGQAEECFEQQTATL